jgi:hypothetical protein
VPDADSVVLVVSQHLRSSPFTTCRRPVPSEEKRRKKQIVRDRVGSERRENAKRDEEEDSNGRWNDLKSLILYPCGNPLVAIPGIANGKLDKHSP